MIKIDRSDPNEATFYDAYPPGQHRLLWTPPGLEMVDASRAAQASYIQSYFSQFGRRPLGCQLYQTR